MAFYLLIDGLKGNATSPAYKNFMNVSSYSWGFSIPVKTSGGGASNRQSPGKVEMGELHVTKTQDTTTPILMQKAFSGTHFASGSLALTRMVQGAEVEMCRYDMTDVLLSHYTTGGAEDGGNPTESLSLHFAKMGISQTSTDATGAVAGGPVRADWNIATQGVA